MKKGKSQSGDGVQLGGGHGDGVGVCCGGVRIPCCVSDPGGVELIVVAFPDHCHILGSACHGGLENLEPGSWHHSLLGGVGHERNVHSEDSHREGEETLDLDAGWRL